MSSKYIIYNNKIETLLKVTKKKNVIEYEINKFKCPPTFRDSSWVVKLSFMSYDNMLQYVYKGKVP